MIYENFVKRHVILRQDAFNLFSAPSRLVVISPKTGSGFGVKIRKNGSFLRYALQTNITANIKAEMQAFY